MKGAHNKLHERAFISFKTRVVLTAFDKCCSSAFFSRNFE